MRSNMVEDDPKKTHLSLSFWLILAAVVLIGPNLDQLLGFSWFDAIRDALGISSITFVAGVFIAALALIGILQWVPKSKR